MLKSLINNLLGRGRNKQPWEEQEENKVIVFFIKEGGKEWKRDNVLILDKGISGYLIYIYDKEEITDPWPSEEVLKGHEDTIICDVPNVSALRDFLSRLHKDRPPRFYVGGC